MFAIGLDDLMPVVLLVGAVVGVWLYNRLSTSRPGRRRRRAGRAGSSNEPGSG